VSDDTYDDDTYDEDDANVADDTDVDQDDGDDDYNRKDPNVIEGATAATVLEYITKAVVDEPEAVEVDTREGRRGTVSLEVQVADDDMGRVIGKRGRVANSIRTVVRAAAARDGVEVDVEFVE
jgi:predicted RNA-binding protein YlqC (UPF0109 family)